MDNFYIKVDTDFLNTLNEEVRAAIEKEINKKPEYTAYIRMCPYCNVFYTIYVDTESIITKKINPDTCTCCGEQSPFFKFEYSMKKVRALYILSISNLPTIQGIEPEEIERDLLEQCIVNLATGIELLFKEIFILGMDLKFVKSQRSLFSKFYKDAKNDFLNIDKLNERYNEDLKIDIKSILGKDLFKELKTILLKRNVIVHNNGMADKTFINQSNIACKFGRPIPINVEEIKTYLSIADSLIENIKQMFNQEFLPELMDRAYYNIYKYYH